MITQVSIATLPVRDQGKSLDFFVGKLGFKVRTDAPDGRQICITQTDTV